MRWRDPPPWEEESPEEANTRMVEAHKVHEHQLAVWNALLTRNLLTPPAGADEGTKMEEPAKPGTDVQEDH